MSRCGVTRTRARSGHHPLGAWCNNTFESLAFKLRQGSAGSNIVADHIEVLDEAIAQIPAKHRRNLLITVDGAGASHGLIDHISTLNRRPGYCVHYSVGWDLGEREHAAIGTHPGAQHLPSASIDINKRGAWPPPSPLTYCAGCGCSASTAN